MSKQQSLMIRCLPNQVLDPCIARCGHGVPCLLRVPNVEQYRPYRKFRTPPFKISDDPCSALHEFEGVARSRLKRLHVNMHVKFRGLARDLRN